MLRFLLYLFRWQLSTIILAPTVAYFKHSPSIWGTKEDWIAAVIANLIGGCIFFWIDRFIFRSKVIEKWEILKVGSCHDCGKVESVGRLVTAPGGYDKTDDENPEYRCRGCSELKLKELQKRRKVQLA